MRLEPFDRIKNLNSAIRGTHSQKFGSWIKFHLHHELILRFHCVQALHFAKGLEIKFSVRKRHLVDSYQIISVCCGQDLLVRTQRESANVFVELRVGG